MQLPGQPASRAAGRDDDVIVRLEKRLQECGLEDNRKTQGQKNSTIDEPTTLRQKQASFSLPFRLSSGRSGGRRLILVLGRGNRSGKGLAVHRAGKMYRAFAIDRIPAGRIGGAGKLGEEADFPDRIFSPLADQLAGRIPGCAAGRPTHDLNADEPVADDTYAKFRSTEPLAV